MKSPKGPGYSALSRGRYSSAGEQYFLTFNLERPQSGLEHPELTSAIKDELSRREAAGVWAVRTAIVMPDHVHLMVCLKSCHALGDAVRLLKGRLAPRLKQHGICWQRSFYDHRMRHAEDLLSVFLYVFLNPHRAGILRAGDAWPGYICAADDWKWFEPLSAHGAPWPEWLEGRAGCETGPAQARRA
jgi:REP element-mobilizing transposase RayT